MDVIIELAVAGVFILIGILISESSKLDKSDKNSFFKFFSFFSGLFLGADMSGFAQDEEKEDDTKDTQDKNKNIED